MNTGYDVLVIGGGPGGAIAARTAAEKGLRTCLIEKRPAIGTPVRCAEGICKHELSEFIEPDYKWISAEISQAGIVSPDQTMMVLDSSIAGSKVGYVLERKIFDRALVNQAAAAGADIFVKTSAKAPIITDGVIRGARIDGGVSHIQADVVIAADGVESQFARRCGIDTSVKPGDMMSCAQYLLSNIDINPAMNVFHFGNTIAPGGYIWIFPKGERSANVGVGIAGSKSGEHHRAKDYLDAFVKEKFPDGKTLELIAGGIPVSRPLATTVSDGLMIVGDAARVADPLTGGGIYNSMFTGRLAGETAVGCIAKGDCSRNALSSYDKKWRVSPMGQGLNLNYKIKEFLYALSDEKLNKLMQSATRLNLKEFSVLNIVKELALNNPGLLWDMREIIPELYHPPHHEKSGIS
jgi:digeranylgeranylglycerophospholipid reductase